MIYIMIQHHINASRRYLMFKTLIQSINTELNSRIILFCFSFVITFNSWALEEQSDADRLKTENNYYDEMVLLRPNEPNILGFRKDANDGWFLDIKLSLKYPINHDGLFKDKHERNLFPFWSFAFTGAWAQYMFDRKSSPVIAKRYNPEIFARWWLRDKHNYIDVMYGHESNGQSIGSWDTYNVKQLEISSIDDPESGDNIENARDYISRGWDYIGFTYKTRNPLDIYFFEKQKQGNFFYGKTLTTYMKFRYFLKDGLLQGGNEDFNPWEVFGPQCIDDENKIDWTFECHQLNDKYSRDRYDGLTFIFKNDTDYGSVFKGIKTALIYTTGYKDVFENSTVRLEHTLNYNNLPIMIWMQTGYNSDLVDYYKRVKSYGIALELRY